MVTASVAPFMMGCLFYKLCGATFSCGARNLVDPALAVNTGYLAVILWEGSQHANEQFRRFSSEILGDLCASLSDFESDWATI